MSVKVMNWVFSESRSRKSARMLLLSIADRANDEGMDAWPSQTTLAAKAGVSERTVRRLLDDLVALGELRVEGRPGLTNYYTVVMQSCLPLTPGPEPKHADQAPAVPSDTPVKMSGVPDGDPGQTVRGANCHPGHCCPPTPDMGVRPPRTLLAAKTSGTSSTSSTHTPRAREASAAPEPGGSLTGSHRAHAACVAPCCVPASLHREFVRKSGISDEADADAAVRAWYRDVSAIWDGREVTDDDFGFWRARWKERKAAGVTINGWTPRVGSDERPGIWGDIFERLKLDIGSHAAGQWFGGVTVAQDTGAVLTLALPSEEYREFLSRRYGETLQLAAESVRPGTSIELFVAEAA